MAEQPKGQTPSRSMPFQTVAPARAPVRRLAGVTPESAPQQQSPASVEPVATFGASLPQAFVSRLRDTVTEKANQELAEVGRTAQGCPYVAFWLDYYSKVPAAHFERAARLYAKPKNGSEDALLEAIGEKTLTAVRHWKQTGEALRLPDLPALTLEQLSGDPQLLAHALGPGNPLAPDLRLRAETAFGQPLPDVQVHTSGEATALAARQHARAFAVGEHVVFGPGEYRPGTLVGDAVLGHELGHVVQQARAPNRSVAGGGRHEAEANLAGARFAAHDLLHGPPLTLSATGGLALQRCEAIFGSGEEVHTSDTSVPEKVPAPNQPDLMYDDATSLTAPNESEVYDKDGWYHFDIDGDGDQVKELRIRSKVTKKSADNAYIDQLDIELSLLSDLKNPQNFTFDLTSAATERPSSVMFVFAEPTDGLNPTRFQLSANGFYEEYMAEVDPPKPGIDQRDYTVRLLFGLHDARKTFEHTYSFAKETAAIHQVFRPGTPQTIGGVTTVPTKVGMYGDPFLLTFEQPLGAGDDVVMGILPTTDNLEVRQGKRITLGKFKDLKVSIVSSVGPALNLDIDGDGQTDATVYVETRADPGTGYQPVAGANDRSHIFHVSVGGQQQHAGFFEVKNGELELGAYQGNSGEDLEVPAAAAAAKALKESKEGGAEAQDLLTLLELGRAKIREEAVTKGVLDKGLLQAFKDLGEAMQTLAARAAQDKAPGISITLDALGLPSTDAAFSDAEGKAKAFDDAFKDPSGPGKVHKDSIISQGYVQIAEDSNTYTDYYDEGGLGRRDRAAVRLQVQLHAKDYGKSLEIYKALLNGFDLYLQDTLKASPQQEIQDLGTKLKSQNDLRTELGKLPFDKSPKRVYAVFTPEESFKQSGVPATTEVLLFYWLDGKTWYLRDLTRPASSATIFTDDCPFTQGETEPPHKLFLELDYKKHFSKGYVHYELPSGRGGVVRTNANNTWADYFAWAAAGIGALALIVGTAGAGSGVVTMLVVASAVAGAVSAGLDIREMLEHGNVDGGEIALDVINIIGSLAGAGSLVLRELSVGASVANTAKAVGTGSRLGNALGQWAKANKGVVFSLAATSLTADAINLGVMVHGVYEAYKAIDQSPGSEADHQRAKLWLLAKAGGMGALGVLALKGGFKDLGEIKGALQLEGVGNGLVLRGEPGSFAEAEYQRFIDDAFAKDKPRLELKTADEMKALTHDDFTLAVTKLDKDGKAVIYVLDGAHPRVMLEETIHAQQMLDPKLGKLADVVAKTLEKDWSTVGKAERLTAMKAKLELEIDAQKKLIAHYEGVPQPNAAAGTAMDEAYQHLEALRDKYGNLLGAEKGAKSAGDIDPMLDKPPELATKLPEQGFGIPDEWKALDEDAFVAAYQKRYPTTTLTEDELRKRFKFGKRLNPDTWRLKDPTYKGRPEPTITAKPGPKSEKQVGDLWQVDKDKLDKLLKKRDAAWKTKQSTTATEKELATAHYEMNDASREIGEMVADAYAKDLHPGAERVYGGEGSRSGDFDLVYAIYDKSKTPPVVKKYIVVESKGGSADLGVKKVTTGAGPQIAQQGTREYFQSIIDVMKKSATSKNDKKLLAHLDGMQAALESSDVESVLDYVLIKTPIGGPPSTVGKTFSSSFDIKVTAPK
ncbi:MAG: DUF4157 domain-containing protein [Myxococcaceae bacterium]